MTSETGFDPKLYERFPTAEDRPPDELEKLEAIWKAPRGWARLTVVNNNYIGVYYVAAAFLFFVLAGGLAVIMRTQLALPLNGVLSQETYNQFFTMHGRSEEHTSELQSLMRISYAVFCLNKKTNTTTNQT